MIVYTVPEESAMWAHLVDIGGIHGGGGCAELLAPRPGVVQRPKRVRVEHGMVGRGGPQVGRVVGGRVGLGVGQVRLLRVSRLQLIVFRMFLF